MGALDFVSRPVLPPPNGWASVREELEGKLSETEATLASAVSQLEETREKRDTLQAELTETQQARDTLQSDLDASRALVEELQGNKKQLESRVGSLEASKSQLESKLSMAVENSAIIFHAEGRAFEDFVDFFIV